MSRTVYAIITTEVPETILQAYISLSRHICKDGILRQIYVTQQLVASNFAKKPENIQRELCLNVIIPFSIIVCCLVIE